MGGTTLAKDDRGPRHRPAERARCDRRLRRLPRHPEPGGEGAAARRRSRRHAGPRTRPRAGPLQILKAGTGLALGLQLAALRQLAPAAATPGHRRGPAGHADTGAHLLGRHRLPPHRHGLPALHGKLGDLHGRKGMVLLALALFCTRHRALRLGHFGRSTSSSPSRAVQGSARRPADGSAGPRRRNRPDLAGPRLTAGCCPRCSATGAPSPALLLGRPPRARPPGAGNFHLTVPCALTALVLLAAALRDPAAAASRPPGPSRPSWRRRCCSPPPQLRAVPPPRLGRQPGTTGSSRTVTLGLAAARVGFPACSTSSPPTGRPSRSCRCASCATRPPRLRPRRAAFGAALFGTARRSCPPALQHHQPG